MSIFLTIDWSVKSTLTDILTFRRHWIHSLFGIATENGILLVSNYEILQLAGMNILDAVLQGSRDRLSPILMTALTAGLALIPLAIAGDLAGNEIQSPMAKVILGGLLTSTLLNLFVVPIVYFLTNRKKPT